MNKLHHPLAGILGCTLLFVSSYSHAAPWEKITMNGYYSFEYEKTVSGTEEDQNGSFDLDLIDIVLNYQSTDNLRVATDLTWEHGAASEDGRGNVAVEYAFAEYTINDLFKIKAGKMFTHFGIYNEIHTAKPANLTIKEPLATNKNNKFGSEERFYPRWLTGIAVTGNGYVADMSFDYDVQLSNGESNDSNAYEEDDNIHKAFNARLRLMPIDTLRVGASVYQDTMVDHAAGGGDPTDINSYSIHAEWDTGETFGAEFEYIWGTEGYADSNVNPDIDRNAVSAMFLYYLTPTIRTYVRHESIEPNKDVDDDGASRDTIGINWMFDSNAFLKFEYDEVSTEANNAKFSGEDFSEIKASIAIGF